MKKIFMFLILGLFLISLASASVNYEEENKIYTVDTIWPTWLGGDGQSIVKLVNNTDECLIDCSFTLEFNNEQKVSLLEDIAFLDRKGQEVQHTLKNLDFQIGKYENITTTTPIYEQSCEDIFNETTNNVTQSCEQIQTGEDTNTEEVLTWNNYNGELVNGLSYLKVNAKKNPFSSMDWIITFRGEDLVKWAWWNSSWDYKREITITENSGSSLSNYSVLINVPYSANMKTDFSDLRFLDSTETEEIGYWIENKTDSTEAWIWVKAPSLTASSNTSIYMYYGNSLASSNSERNSAFLLYNLKSSTESTTQATVINYTRESISINGDWKFKELTVELGHPVAGTGAGYFKAYIDNNPDNKLWFGDLSCTNYEWNSTTACRLDGEDHWIRSALNERNSGATGNGNYNFIFEFFQSGTGTAYVYSVEVEISAYATSEPTYTIGAEQINSGTINVDFVTPPTPVNYANISDPNITIEVNPTYVNASLTNISYDFYNVNGTLTTFFFENETYQINISLPTAHFHYNVTVCGEETITPSDICASTETRHLNHDVTPPEINLTSPTGIYDYLIEGYELDLNWTVTDEGEGLDSCWYSYNGTNNTLTCNDNHTTFNYVTDLNNLTFWANDTFGNYQNNLTSWTYKLLEVNQTYNAEVTEGSLETFLAHTKLGSGISIEDAVLFNYNNSETTGQAFTLGDYNILRKANYLVPGVSADTNFTFYWNVVLSDSTEINLSSQNQTVYNLAVDNCSSYTNELYNFSVVDEEEQTPLPTATIETAFNFYDAQRSEIIFNYSMQFEGVNPLRICLNRNISSGSEYSLDVLVRYEDTGSANEYYNIVNTTINNESTSQKIILYDLNLTDSTDFQLTFTGSDFLPVENALVYVDRQYISENQFKTVELPKTDYNGQSVLHLVRNDVIYNIRILKDGVVLGNFENLVAFCEDFTIGDCNIELNAFDSVEAVYNYDESLGIIFTAPSYNETSNKVTFNFLTEDGEAKTVKLEVSRNDIFGNRSICNSTLTSSGGTLTCNIDPNLDESNLKTEVYVDGVLAISGNVQLDSSGYGVAGYLIMFVMAISFILMFSGSKTGVLVAILLTFIASISFGLVAGDIIGIGASGLWLLVIVIIGIIKLNQERAQ